jgi:valyl-tRNA synthetase
VAKLINIFTEDAKIKSEWWADALPDTGSGKENVIYKGNATVNIIPKKYRGLDRFEARKQIIKDLDVVLFLTNQQHKSYRFHHTKQGYDAPTKFGSFRSA